MRARLVVIAALAGLAAVHGATPARPTLKPRRAVLDGAVVAKPDLTADAVASSADKGASGSKVSLPFVPVPSLQTMAILAAFTALVTVSPLAPAISGFVSGITSNPILRKAAKKAIGGGMGGMIAGVVQVLTLMWLRTAMNYQYRHGVGTKDALRILYEEGGIGRFYQGVGWALLQTPLARFGDTAANTGVLELLAATAFGSKLPVGIRTACASAAGSMWRIGITPLDTLKTTLQVEGKAASDLLAAKVKADGLSVLYAGCLANALASFIGSYPWFFTFNLMNELLPAAPAGVLIMKLLRSALLGCSATCVSDTISNSLRVIKTTKQTSADSISYTEATMRVVEKDGYIGLFTRGLGTRLITNCIQASMFTIVWKLIEEKLNAKV